MNNLLKLYTDKVYVYYENQREEYDKTETTPTTVETKTEVSQQDVQEESCECLESSGSQDSFISAEDNESMDENLSSNKEVEQKIKLLEDCLKTLIKPWNLGEVDSTEDQQSTTDSEIQTTNYRQYDETENDNFGFEDSTESIAPELGEILSVVLRNTWFTDSMHDDVHDATPTTKVIHMSSTQTSTSTSRELTDNEMSQIKPGYSAILDSILTQSANDYTLNLENYETPFAVEYISKEEARRRRWLPPKTQRRDSSVPVPSLLGCQWDDKEDSHNNAPTTNVYYCTECQLTGEEESFYKTFAEKLSPRRKLQEYDNVMKLLAKDKMKQFEQAEKLVTEEGHDKMYDDVNRSGTIHSEVSAKTHDHVLSEYQKQLICGHINYLNKVEDPITLSGEGVDEMRRTNRHCSRLPDVTCKCGPDKNLQCFSRGFQTEKPNWENDVDGYAVNYKECISDKGIINYPTRIQKENKGTAANSFGDGHRSHFFGNFPSETCCLESLQIDPCRDYSTAFGNFALKSEVTEVTNGKEGANILSLPSTYSNINDANEEIDKAVVCSHDQERFVGAQSLRVNDIPSISRKRRRKSVTPKGDTSDEYSAN